jgi:hypothetical protein
MGKMSLNYESCLVLVSNSTRFLEILIMHLTKTTFFMSLNFVTTEYMRNNIIIVGHDRIKCRNFKETFFMSKEHYVCNQAMTIAHTI